MSEIGYDITRNGTPVQQLPDICFNSVVWEQESNTQINTSPFTKAGQTNELSGARWKATYTYNIGVGKDKDIGKIRAALVKLRGAAGRFFGTDPSWCTNLGIAESSGSASVTVVIPEYTAIGGALFPREDLYPSETQYPNVGDGDLVYPEYTFTLSTSLSSVGDITVQNDLLAGSNSCTVNAVSGGEFVVNNSNPWDFSQGVRPEYDIYLNNGLNDLETLLKENSGGSEVDGNILEIGDYIRIEDAMRMVVEEFKSGDTEIVFEPPLIHPVSAGTKVVTDNVGVIMRLVDDNQAKFQVGSGQIHNRISFSAIEAL